MEIKPDSSFYLNSLPFDFKKESHFKKLLEPENAPKRLEISIYQGGPLLADLFTVALKNSRNGLEMKALRSETASA